MKTKKKTAAKSESTTKSKSSSSNNKILKRAKQVLARMNVDGTVAIMHLDNDQCFYTLEGLAAEFWSLIDGKTSVEQIKTTLATKHKPPAKRFENDVNKLISDLKKEKLVLT